MNLLFDSTLKISIILLAALAVAELLHRRSAAVRHWVLAVAVVCAFAVPLLGAFAPKWSVSMDFLSPARPSQGLGTVSTIAVLEEISIPAVEPDRQGSVTAARPDGNQVVWLVAVAWTVGAALTLTLLFVGLARLAWLASTARRVDGGRWAELTDEIRRTVGLRRPVTLLLTDRSAVLGTWGIARPKILLPSAARDWSDERARIVLSHELAHIQRGDWATQMAAEALRAVYWFNPLAWIACGRLRQESEHACDDAVLNAGVDGSA